MWDAFSYIVISLSLIRQDGCQLLPTYGFWGLRGYGCLNVSFYKWFHNLSFIYSVGNMNSHWGGVCFWPIILFSQELHPTHPRPLWWDFILVLLLLWPYPVSCWANVRQTLWKHSNGHWAEMLWWIAIHSIYSGLEGLYLASQISSGKEPLPFTPLTIGQEDRRTWRTVTNTSDTKVESALTNTPKNIHLLLGIVWLKY